MCIICFFYWIFKYFNLSIVGLNIKRTLSLKMSSCNLLAWNLPHKWLKNIFHNRIILFSSHVTSSMFSVDFVIYDWLFIINLLNYLFIICVDINYYVINYDIFPTYIKSYITYYESAMFFIYVIDVPCINFFC